MKLVFLMTDTFRWDHIGAYGNKRIFTPNLDRLAATANVFDQYWIGSFPTGPTRRDILLGRGDMANGAFNAWVPMTDEEIPVAQYLGEAGVHSMMINDTQNCLTRGRNYQKGFSAWTLNRGQEGDPVFSDASVDLEFPVPPELIRYSPDMWHRILTNRAGRRVEDDWHAPGTYKLGCEWLERNRKRDNFFLWLETFDPHEPWDPPRWYVDRYDPGYKGRVFDAPIPCDYKKVGITEAERNHIHARYCGECTMVDAAVGRVLATLEKLDLLDEVMIVFTTDHGQFFGLEGDYGILRKKNFMGEDGALWNNPKDWAPLRFFPFLPGVSHIPLMIKTPRQRRTKRFRQIVQPWDLTPTILEAFGQTPPDDFVGRSLLPLIEGKATWRRPFAFHHDNTGHTYQATSRDWMYADFGDRQEPWLLDLKNDWPKRYTNKAKKEPAVAARMRAALTDFRGPMLG